MSGQVATARQREQTYRTALTESQEHERLRIAREIHDDTIQALVLVSHSIERAAQAVHSGQNAVVAQLESGRSQLLAAIDCLRRLISNLRPTALDELGLVVALEMLCEQHRSLRFCVKGEVYSLEHPVELALFRAAQEAIRNAERHAHAHCITVTLNYARSVVLLEVSDDGTGFTIPHQLQEFAAHGHFGLMGMRERIDHLGGTLQLKSAPGDGSIITIRLPVVRCDADARHPLVIPVGAFRQSVSGKQRLLRPM
jgi:signal transduction histidine kinase